MRTRKGFHMRFARLLCSLAAAATTLAAQENGQDAAELQKQTQNPVSSLISVPFQNNINFPVGSYSRVQNILNIQPVIPIQLSNDWNLITRWIVPVVYQPNLLAAGGAANGLGDINPTFLLSPAHPGSLIWGFGPTLLFPTATQQSLGQGKWGAGPAIVLATQPGPWTLGVLTNNIWSYAGDRERSPVDQLVVQYFANYNLKNGWYTGTQPILTCNWKATASNGWTVPFGWSAGKIVRLGKQAVNAQLGAYYDLIHPRDLPYGKWEIRLQLAFLFPRTK
jgi:hypothetical protein